ncbi:hypothetical protein [Reyranella sp. CPCC 100927]|uniref:hypothetical protein n=1 Tax=Reyranella sp. CPCC 100927 TaxID=2599616 RepID=UPI0011B66D42|nr:hypothetical protein [Reyranella sp. CPCC 100927]TWT00292.1 hypothetical protein FQU96_33750 [Reyranella sp. CPCC 100927]
MAREIDRKLRLTAALLGAVTRKDLAAAFRRVNPATTFDVERANKWLQGRARPRERQVYEDWAKLVDLGRDGAWIAECDSEAFLEAICARHQRDPGPLRRQADGAEGPSNLHHEQDLSLAGSYACYSHAWSPYFRGQLIRGSLAIAPAQRLSASYTETLPTGRLQVDGPITLSKRAMLMDLREPGGTQFLFCLFPPTPPASVLAGFMCGATVIGPHSQPSVTRIAMVRLPAASARLRNSDAYLPLEGSVASDLAAQAVPVADPELVDRQMQAFLVGGQGGGLDQIGADAYAALQEVFDRTWLAAAASPFPASGERKGPMP